MIKSTIGFKKTMAIIFNIIAIVLITGSYMIPVYKYGWAQESELSGIVNDNAVLTIIVFSVVSIISATIAFVFKL